MACVRVYLARVLLQRVCVCAPQLAAAKGGEIEELLGRLSDVNDEMGSALSGAGDSRAHTLARHREIMVELTQVRRQQGLARC